MQAITPIDAPARFFRVVENKSPYDPDWDCVPPLETLHFSYDTGKTTTQNGAALKGALQALVAGDSLVIGAGTYNIDSLTVLDLQGTAGQPRNIVENNICYGSGDNVMQIQGECIVRNNLVMAGAGSAFASQPHQGNPTALRVVHNTFVNTGTAARLSAWDAETGMEFANNACYSQGGAALQAISSTAGVAFAGNVSFGSVTAGVGGFHPGSGLADFVDVSWDATHRDARPGALSPLLGAGDAAFATPVDLGFLPRDAPHTAGCHGP